MNYMGTNDNISHQGEYDPASGKTVAYDASTSEIRTALPSYHHGHNVCESGTLPMQSSVAYAVSRNGTKMMPHHISSGCGTVSNGKSSSADISLRPEVLTNTDYLPAYLTQYIGHWIRADFFIGDAIEQRVGILREVGASYIIIDAIEPATLIVCDIYSLKFATVILDDDFTRLMRV